MNAITGTCYFRRFQDARRYYRAYGFNAADVREKIADGEIKIGKPPLNRGELFFLDPVEYRYFVEKIF